MKPFLLLAIFFFTICSFSQTTIFGKIVDEKNKPISNANIYIDGTYDGATSNNTGEFSFTTTAEGSQTLVISALSFEPKQLAIVMSTYQSQTLILKHNATELNEVLITAGTIESGGKSRVSVLKPLDILTTAGNPGDIISAFKTLPGTQIVGESGKLFVRGGEANETQTFVDGIRVAQPYLQTANNVPTRSTFSPLLFKGTTFSTGGYSAEYGEALSSILVMNTIDEPDLEKTDIGVMTVGLGLGNTQKWKNNSLSVNTSYINLQPYQSLLPDNIEWIKPYESIGGETVFRQKLDRGLLKFYASYTAANFDLKQDDVNYPDKLRTQNKNNNLYSNLSYKGGFGDNWNIFAGISFAKSRNSGIYDVYNYDASENASHLKLKLTKPISNTIKTSFGADYFYTNFSESVTNSDSGYHSNIFAAFSETDFLVTNNLITKVGFRFSKNYLLDESSIAPRLALAYKVAKNQQFSMAYGTFDQAPKNDYLKYSTSLQAEKSQHYILSYEFNKDKQIFKAEVYYKSYDNLVKYDTKSPVYNSNFNNSGSGYAKGLELFWRDNKNIKNLEYWISYSYIDTERDYANFPKQATPSFIADHTFSLVTKYWIQDWRSQIGTTYTFSSGRPYNNPNETVFMDGKTKTYNNLSVNWAYLISPQKILFFSVTNVAGIKNVYGYNYANTTNSAGIYESQAIVPTADRFFFVGFFWTISKDKKTNQLENL
ncbi:Outer membrane receptor for ferrienterochelin and colicins [Flavobacterium fluvii]|uniref:Outer membrane receptor for ferrienterochelin and colicins n=1 Tax=Flavobacterium fluvii TaxID=468056 RepID=A0A1M5P0N8_9FLAO|nr:TonB-dependent receptor [Flavobacterium fluvii]SHG94999.1 Outer membrane receptor for ferrienterochelin and colicins [Flavobacterium fluvii]